MTKTIDSQFLLSLKNLGKSYMDEEDYYTTPPNITDENMVADTPENRLFHIAYTALSREYLGKCCRHLEMLVNEVESPIEEAMLYALVIVAHKYAENVRYKVKNYVVGDAERGISSIIIEPQAYIGNFRVDFLVTYEELIPDYENTKILDSGKEVYSTYWFKKKLVIECDGHDFHERTKEQAKTDRSRDRALQTMGYGVFRFTGSEIWGDAINCADEALKSLIDAAMKENK